ncbi:MAG: hypothetical protein JSV80_03870 [Acidobacteriota bacterium]|nr:MAG: hypothetical protein JSV80_03870 [Acidobacteriota bacterium]
MRKALLRLCATVCAAVCVVAGSFGDGFAGASVTTDVISDDGERTVVKFTFHGYETETVSIGGELYERVMMPGEPISREKGAPALPYAARSIIVPDDAEMSLNVLSSSYEETLISVAPSKGPLSRRVDPATVPYEFGAVYHVDAFLPGRLASLSSPYIMRDHRGAVITVYPFQYNPVSKVLRVFREIVVEVVSIGPGKINVFHRSDAETGEVRSFQEIYEAHFLNYAPPSSSEDYDPIDEEGEMLIICHDPWLGEMSEFVSHKQSIGITTELVGVGTIGNDASSIKSYIQNAYDTRDLAFVLLVGDAAQVATPQAHGGAADPIYSKLAGNDDYPEILVGRFSAQTVEQLQTQVDRTIDYEDSQATQTDWFKRGTGIASSEGAGQGDEGQSDKQHMSEIRSWLLADDYTLVDEIYDPGARDSHVADAVNAGRGIVNYCGHGSQTGWGTSGFNNADVNALVNDDELPFIFSVACNNGEFDTTNACFAEAWLRATNDTTGAPTGAIAMYGSSILQSWAPPMEAQDEFNLLLTNTARPYHSIGALYFAGSSSMMDAYSASGVEMFDTWIVFGDPSLRVVGTVGPRTGLEVQPSTGLVSEGPAGGPLAPLSIDYTLLNHDETPLEYEVLADEPWISISSSRGTIEAGGSVPVTVQLNDGARNLDNGQHRGEVSFVNLTNHDGDTTRSVTVNIGQRLAMYRMALEEDPGWSLEGEWEFGRPTGEGGGAILNPDPDGGCTGDNVYGTNLLGNITPMLGGPYYLTAGPFDLQNVSGVQLEFERWLNLAGPPYGSASVEVSNNGSIWYSTWIMSETTTDGAWSRQSFDVSNSADNRDTFYVRWGYGVTHQLPLMGSGWNIDDIELNGLSETTARVELLVERDRLNWSDLHGATSYDVVRGDLVTLLSTGGNFAEATDTCLADDHAGTTLDHADAPAPGEGFWMLVRGVALSGPMTYQSLSLSQQGVRDEEIEAATGSCP